MAFDQTKFFPIGHGAGNTIYIYTSADAIATVVGSGYFNGTFAPVLNKGDTIIAVTSNTGTIAVDVLVVSSASGAATVTTTNGT